MKVAAISAEQAMSWEESTARFRPKPIRPTDRVQAVAIPSFTTFGGEDGVIVRLAGTTGGTIDVFLNAVVALQLVNKISEIGHRAMWRNEDDGSLIVRDPQNLGHVGQKS